MFIWYLKRFKKIIYYSSSNKEEGLKSVWASGVDRDDPEVRPQATNQEAEERLSLQPPAGGRSHRPRAAAQSRGGDTSDSRRLNVQLYTFACLHGNCLVTSVTIYLDF